MTIATKIKTLRKLERLDRAQHDPWFGKRRKSGEMGRRKTKAERSRKACRGKIED